MNRGESTDHGGETDATQAHSEVDRVLFEILKAPPEERYSAFKLACKERPDLADAVGTRYRFMFAAHAVDSLAQAAPEAIGPFRVERLLGEGGMGRVFLAEQSKPFHRMVAIKLIRVGMDTDQVLKRFEAEREALARLAHSNIATIFEAGLTAEGRPWFAMEYVNGMSILEYAAANDLGVEKRVGLLIQVCRGIAHAHEIGILHRDIKPSNVLVAQENGQPLIKIIDFGLARAFQGPELPSLNTMTGQWVGTPTYASPEQVGLGTSTVDQRSDMFGIGMLAYELLVGRLPEELSEGSASAATLQWQRRLLTGNVGRPSQLSGSKRTARYRKLRSHLDWILLKAIEGPPAKRYASVEELGADFESYLAGSELRARAPRLHQRTLSWVHKRAAWIVGSTMLTLSLVLGMRLGAPAMKPRPMDYAPAYRAHALDLHGQLDRGELRGNGLHSELQAARGRLTKLALGASQSFGPRPSNGGFEIVSVSSDSTPADGSSGRSHISGEGRYIVFESHATNLVPGDSNGLSCVYVVDRDSDSIQRVSVSSKGAQANRGSFTPMISANGRHVVFVSSADNLVPGDTNNAADVFLHDLVNQQTTRIPSPENTVDGSYACEWLQISGQGDWIAFTRNRDISKHKDVFLYERATKSLRLVSEGLDGHANGSSSIPSISDDGRFVAFQSTASNLVDGDTNAREDIFLYQATTETLRRVSLTAAGKELNGNSQEPVLSGNGRMLSFRSNATNLVPGCTGGKWQLYAVDLTTGAVELLSVTSEGEPGNAYSHRADWSDDGRFAIFDSRASNLSAGDTGLGADVFVRDRLRNKTHCLTRHYEGSTNPGTSHRPRISGDGQWACFDGDQRDLAPDLNPERDVYLVQLGGVASGGPRLLTRARGAQAGGNSSACVISRDGSTVVTRTSASHLVKGDTNGVGDVFSIKLLDGTIERISLTPEGRQNAGTSGAFGVDRSGNRIVFIRRMSQDGTQPDREAVYLRDLAKGTLQRIDVGRAGPANGNSNFAGISASGRYVTFVSSATNLFGPAPPPTSKQPRIFIKDLQTGELRRVRLGALRMSGLTQDWYPRLGMDGAFVTFISGLQKSNGSYAVSILSTIGGSTPPVNLVVGTGPKGSLPEGNCFAPMPSDDGSIVAFISKANNLIPGVTPRVAQAYIWTRKTQVCELLTRGFDGLPADAPVHGLKISGNGRFAFFTTDAENVVPSSLPQGRHGFIHDRHRQVTAHIGRDMFFRRGNGFEGDSGSLSEDGFRVVFSASHAESLAGSRSTPTRHLVVWETKALFDFAEYRQELALRPKLKFKSREVHTAWLATHRLVVRLEKGIAGQRD